MRVLASMIAAVLIAGATVARAHQAPRGWDYPFYCCLDSDCAQIDAEAVREVTGGFVVIGLLASLALPRNAARVESEGYEPPRAKRDDVDA